MRGPLDPELMKSLNGVLALGKLGTRFLDAWEASFVVPKSADSQLR